MRALVVEDDESVSRVNRRLLELEGFQVDVALTAAAAQNFVADGSYEIVMLDMALPDGCGIDVLHAIRRQSTVTPVLIVSGAGDPDSTAGALDAGADDYIRKPYETGNVTARVRALMRRSRVSAPADVQCGNVTLTRRLRNATIAGLPVNLTPKEYFLLECFITNPEKVIARTELLDRIWGVDFDPGTNVVDVSVSRLRAKLSRSGASCSLESERGIGYVLRSDCALH